MQKVLVVGSINMDFVVQASRFPAPGETLLGSSFTTFSGGKGANQAVAAQRLGADVTFLGCVGNDDFGKRLIENLRAEGIRTERIRSIDGVSTGIAAITVSQLENTILVVPGANHHLQPEDIYAAERAFIDADIVLSQLEIPLQSVEAAAELAARHNKPFLLNPAPAERLPQRLLEQTALLTPNEHELSLALASPNSPNQDWKKRLAAHPERIVMTHGAEGAYYTDALGKLLQQAIFKVDVKDTTGAGDTFNGALAAFWDAPLPERVRLACAASALAVTQIGAQDGMPTREALREFLAARSEPGFLPAN